MNPVELARWQWSDYHLGHADRRNLWIHIVAVPLFLLGNLLLLASVIAGFMVAPWMFIGVLLGPALSAGAMAWQGAGHKVESQAPKPFTGAANVLGRIFLEQWFTFPRFVLTGGWSRAMRATGNG